jgi:hypothetical protein
MSDRVRVEVRVLIPDWQPWVLRGYLDTIDSTPPPKVEIDLTPTQKLYVPSKEPGFLKLSMNVEPWEDYEDRVGVMAAALHESCTLYWNGMRMVHPEIAVTMHGVDAHWGTAHDLVRRLERMHTVFGGTVPNPSPRVPEVPR